jgi:heterodisulfide reductase subunit D
MKISTSLEEIRGAITACIKCSGCTYGPWPENYSFCPIYEHGLTFTASAGGLVYGAKAIQKGVMDYNQSLADLAYTCTACGACDGKCVIVRSINPLMALSDIIRLIRYEGVKRGFVPKGPIKQMYETVKKTGDLAGKTLTVSDKVQNDKADTLLIAECIHTDADAKPFDAAVALLAKMGKQVAVFSDPGCCGSTLYDFGFWDQLPALVEKKWKKIKGFGNKKLLFVDPHCQEFMTNKYRKIIDGFKGFKGQHISELLLDAFKKGKLTSKKMKKTKVSYHDPCFLGRGLGIYDAPRQVLGCLDGVTLIEMKRNREQSFCCGARGLGTYFKDFPETTARVRIQEFLDTKADILITACPHCKDIFAKVLGKDGRQVKDLTEFVSERTA